MASFLEIDITLHLANGGSVRLSTAGAVFKPAANEWHLYGEALSVFSAFAFRKAAEIGPGIDENLAEGDPSLPSVVADFASDRRLVWDTEKRAYVADGEASS